MSERKRASYSSGSRRAVHTPSVAGPSYSSSRVSRSAYREVPEERYRPGGRRAHGEPLRASWRPTPPPLTEVSAKDSGQHRPVKPRGSMPKRMARKYGWRVYALPILVVVTVIALMDAARAPEPSEAAAPLPTPANGTGHANPEQREPAATENPPVPPDLNIPTARLPGGGAFTKQGKGTWHGVPGAGEPVGTGGTLYTYSVEVEDGIDPSSYGGDDAFGKLVEATLSDPRGWTGDGKIRLRRVAADDDPTFRVSLTTPGTNHRPDVCGFTIRYESSCFRRSMDRVVINLARWVRGATAFNHDIGSYRQYAINHEVGHALGNGHIGCPKSGVLAPVMMQQSFGVSNDYVARLNKADPGNYGAVPKDGKVCKPNAWPNPDAAPAG